LERARASNRPHLSDTFSFPTPHKGGGQRLAILASHAPQHTPRKKGRWFVGEVPCGWCGDEDAYTSLANGKVIAETSYIDFTDYEPVGAFTFYVVSTSGRSVAFDFSRPVLDTEAEWCPEVCPGPPADSLPNFVAEPIKTVSLFDTPQYSPPNYDFVQPDICESGWTGNGLCANDFLVKLQTTKKEYRLRFSPNLWRGLALENTAPYGAMGVAYDPVSETWTLSPLLSDVIDGQLCQETCPVSFGRMDKTRRGNVWTFLGCFDMPYQLTLTKR
jgi:hypothetical protein